MKFSENGLYVERYTKCATCGALIYRKEKQELLTCDGVIYCSQWCIDWKKAREARRSKAQITFRYQKNPPTLF
jgi:N-methylhydantoinase B